MEKPEPPPWNSKLGNLVRSRIDELEAELVDLLSVADKKRRLGDELGNAHNLKKEQYQAADLLLEKARRIEEELKVYDRLASRRAERWKSWIGVAGFLLALANLYLRWSTRHG